MLVPSSDHVLVFAGRVLAGIAVAILAVVSRDVPAAFRDLRSGWRSRDAFDR